MEQRGKGYNSSALFAALRSTQLPYLRPVPTHNKSFTKPRSSLTNEDEVDISISPEVVGITAKSFIHPHLPMSLRLHKHVPIS